jgi:hypothetical protein
MRNKVAGTVASSWVQERTGQQADLAAPSGERSVATALNTSGKLLEIPLQCSRKWPGMMVAPSGVQWGLDNERSRLLPRVNAPPLQTLTQPASIRRCLCDAYKRCREKRLLVSLRARKPGRMASWIIDEIFSETFDKVRAEREESKYKRRMENSTKRVYWTPARHVFKHDHAGRSVHAEPNGLAAV